jgi:hypothetical protein
MPVRRSIIATRVAGALLTIGILALVLRKVPLDRFLAALHDANYGFFLAVMVPNVIF